MADKNFSVKNGLIVNTAVTINSTAFYYNNTQFINSTSFAGTANNSSYLNEKSESFYTNATNITTGTINSFRISGNYTGITNVGTLGVLTVSGNVALNNFTINTSPNVVSISSSNVNIDSGVLFVDAVNNRVGVNNTSPDTALTINGSANVSQDIKVGRDLFVNGNFVVTGNLTTAGVTESNGDFIPYANGFNLGDTNRRWSLFGINITLSNNISIGSINSTSVGTSFSNNSIRIGNSSVNSTINATSFSGTANDALRLGNISAGAYQLSSTLSANVAGLTSNNTSFVGSVSAANVVSNAQLSANLINYQTTAGLSANVAVLTANNSNNLNGQPASFYTNANNITTGTINTSRISGEYTGINAVGTLVGLTVTGNVNLDSGVLFVDGINNRVGVNNTSPSVSLQIASNDAVLVPIGNTSQRPSGSNGMFRYNTDIGVFEGYANNNWVNIPTPPGGYYKGNLGAVGKPDNKANLYRINANTQTTNITIENGENAITVGPIVIADGYNLTVQTGGRAVIV